MADELFPTLYGLIGEPPPQGQEFWDAVAVTKEASPSAVDATVLGAAIGAVQASQTGAVEPIRTTENAHRELGLHPAMVWAVNASSLFVFRASTVGTKPKQITKRHPLGLVTVVEVITTTGGRACLDVTLYDVPVRVSGQKDDIERFARSLQLAINQRL